MGSSYMSSSLLLMSQSANNWMSAFCVCCYFPELLHDKDLFRPRKRLGAAYNPPSK
jgi:hypothetical protein